jgi:NitT/TauT family transport system ATP-binding protein
LSVPGSEAALLRASRLRKIFGEDEDRPIEVVGDISFALAEGEIVSIVGPSGCGKTTLLNLLCGLIAPSSGAIEWYGGPIAGMPQGVGYMLQKDLLLPWRTALGNVTLGLEIRGDGRTQRRERARALLAQLGLADFTDHYPATLSGGMRQRVALARTLAHEPRVLLLDEPFASLDFQTKLLIEGDTARLIRSERRTMLLVTHDVEEAVSLSDRVLVLSHRPTRVRSVYDIALDCDRADMLGARRAAGFGDYVAAIWSDLEVTQE